MKAVDLAVDAAAAQEALASFPAKAQRQKEVLAFLLEMKELLPMPMKELLATLQVSAATVKGLEEKGLLVTEDVEVFRDPYQGRKFRATEPLALTAEQQNVYDKINGRLQERRHGVFLLHWCNRQR